MREVTIIGIGMTPVAEHWASNLRDLGAQAIRLALEDAGHEKVSALYVGNAYGSTISGQAQLAPLLASAAGLSGIEGYRIEAGEASGGAALRAGYLAVASGAVDCAIVCGVEKHSDLTPDERYVAQSVSLDSDFEAVHGATLPVLAALVMRAYCERYCIAPAEFEGFSVNAHRNGNRNPLAMYRNLLRPGAFSRAPQIATPISMLDMAPAGDGAAALVLAAADMAPRNGRLPILIRGSAVATDTLALAERADFTHLAAAARSTEDALAGAGLARDDIQLFELHDAFTILSALSLEAAGFVEAGMGGRLAAEYGAGVGQPAISSAGGLKARGNVGGATGIYQAAEACQQLRGEAGDNQLPNLRNALLQNLGGLAATAVTHILQI